MVVEVAPVLGSLGVRVVVLLRLLLLVVSRLVVVRVDDAPNARVFPLRMRGGSVEVVRVAVFRLVHGPVHVVRKEGFDIGLLRRRCCIGLGLGLVVV